VDGFRSGTITQRIQTADGGIEIVVVQVNVVPVGPTDEMKLVARAAFETVNPHPMNMGPREIAPAAPDGRPDGRPGGMSCRTPSTPCPR